MTDRELLELAAKASGIQMSWHDGMSRNTTGFHPAMNIFAAKIWNPLTDDGDALRLAVKLGIQVNPSVGASYASQPDCPNWQEEIHGEDQYAATRRAIVRAAVAIGKSMP